MCAQENGTQIISTHFIEAEIWRSFHPIDIQRLVLAEAVVGSMNERLLSVRIQPVDARELKERSCYSLASSSGE